MPPSFSKPDSDEIITSALQAPDFLLGWIWEKNILEPEELERGFGWYNGQVWVRRDCWPLHSSWPIRAFISETWEEEDNGPGVCVMSISFPQYSRLLLALLPNCLLTSSDPIFILVLCLPPLTLSLSFWSPNLDMMEWYELNKPGGIKFFHLFETFLPSHSPSFQACSLSPQFLFFLEQFKREG